MKETRTITIDSEQYKELLEYSQRSGQSVKDAINEALQDFVASSEKARETQDQ
jgi:predicted CopG family antitoxin